MRSYFLLFGIVFFLLSCKKEPAPDICNQITQHQHFLTEPFKNDYTIQFPEVYTGDGMIGFEGNIFDKRRQDNSVIFNYSYCDSLFCYDFGKNLENLSAQSYTFTNPENEVIELENRLNICDENELLGIFYYQNKDAGTSKLFWHHEGYYREALTVDFHSAYREEVLQILQSIKEK